MTDYRKDFPLLSEIGENTVDGREWIYIDNAATSQRPQCVIDAERDFYLKHNANPLRGNYPLSVEATELYENARKGVRDFIGAKSAREIIFTRNTTESMNLVAYSYGLTNVKEGDEILVSIMEHHSNLLPWQMVARQTGAKLRFIECRPDGSLDLDQVREQITEKTKIVAITQVSNVLGQINPIKEIAAMAHEKNAIIVVITKITIVNIEMKEVERGTKKNFYSADELMDNLRAGARELAEQSLEKAYADVLENYLTYSASGGDVQKVFATRYMDGLQKQFAENHTDL